MCLNYTGILAIHDTFSYFNDTETNETNSFEMGVLDFSLNSSGNFDPDLKPTKLTSTKTINLNKDGTLPFKYKAKVVSATGGLCGYLEVKDDLTGVYQSLSSFVSDETTFSAKPSLIFTVKSSDYSDSLQGEICNFDIVFEAWQENLSDNTQGFTDTETINSTVKMGYWDSDIVMNEFLPNANLYEEFVEFYNNGTSQIDMDGYYVMADANRIDVDFTNTQTYSSGLTTIDPNGWLVVNAGGDLMGDTSGTITLYNQNGVEMDSYTYDASDYNVNNTPGGTNDLVMYLPFDGNLLDLSENNNNGSFKEGASIVSDGKINQALSLDASSKDYIEVADSDSLDITDEITLEAWTKLSSLPAKNYDAPIITKASGTDYGVWNLVWKNNEGTISPRIEISIDGSGYSVYGGTIPITDVWYHIVGTFDGTTMRIYVNGAEEKSTNYPGIIDTNNLNLQLGKQFWCGSIYSYWDGLIDEVKIYDRALSATEVLAHYNAVGTLGSVPADKSYARIPDGTGDWVDPIPTPGAPNVLENIGFIQKIVEVEQLQEQENTEEESAEELPEIFSEELSSVMGEAFVADSESELESEPDEEETVIDEFVEETEDVLVEESDDSLGASGELESLDFTNNSSTPLEIEENTEQEQEEEYQENLENPVSAENAVSTPPIEPSIMDTDPDDSDSTANDINTDVSTDDGDSDSVGEGEGEEAEEMPDDQLEITNEDQSPNDQIEEEGAEEPIEEETIEGDSVENTEEPEEVVEEETEPIIEEVSMILPEPILEPEPVIIDEDPSAGSRQDNNDQDE